MKPLVPNTFNIVSHSNQLIEFDSVERLMLHLNEISDAKSLNRLLIIGRGSNLLMTKDFDGVVVRSRIMGREIIEDGENSVLLRCGSGETVDDVIAWAVEHRYYGMENLSHIPGEVGASAVQNVGAYGVEIKDVLHYVEAVDIETGEQRIIKNEECQYAYRQSIFKNQWKDRFVITHVTYKLAKSFVPKLEYGNIKTFLMKENISEPSAEQLRNAIIEIRKSKLPDPDVTGNAGSFFMNPIVTRQKYEEIASKYDKVPCYEIDDDHVKIPAGWMIEKCGWKGVCRNKAGVHDKQALVLVNLGGATGRDVVDLCREIQKSVSETFGIEIHPEVNII